MLEYDLSSGVEKHNLEIYFLSISLIYIIISISTIIYKFTELNITELLFHSQTLNTNMPVIDKLRII